MTRRKPNQRRRKVVGGQQLAVAQQRLPRNHLQKSTLKMTTPILASTTMKSRVMSDQKHPSPISTPRTATRTMAVGRRKRAERRRLRKRPLPLRGNRLAVELRLKKRLLQNAVERLPRVVRRTMTSIVRARKRKSLNLRKRRPRRLLSRPLLNQLRRAIVRHDAELEMSLTKKLPMRTNLTVHLNCSFLFFKSILLEYYRYFLFHH